ncbi:MAG: type II toxin-antitoxin system RelE/ParE family toxin [Candidatus Electryonea clarkiae]|nr:type II toxin-antitoxin system RelE/ParE family toxin [Candidatus Electryonea clarkiae]MDP8287078.1 type II toxin-antitoxin system RelE/ParE family toxin [Candidatus Electryonea clarkiae]
MPKKMQDKAEARILRLEEAGYELKRPVADILRDGIYELRWSGCIVCHLNS